jgi:hypothetical protein
MQFTPSPPASAYFVAGNTTTQNAMVSSYPSDTPGTIFVLSHAGPTLPVLSKGLADGKVTIAFANKKAAVMLPLPLTRMLLRPLQTDNANIQIK